MSRETIVAHRATQSLRPSIALVLCASAFAVAQFNPAPLCAQSPMNPKDPRLDLDQGWPAGTIREQLNRDDTLVPFGKGAVFVPAMANPLDEPPVTVFRDGNRVLEARTGERIVLNPGRYKVFLGSGSEQQRLEFDAEVREMTSTVVSVNWSGLTVHVVNASFNSLRDSYELINMDDRQYLGVGFGTNEQAGEPIATWIVTPGLYKIVPVGETYRARTDFATVRLLPGKHTHFLWVLDEETRDFEGGGEVSALSAQNLFFQESDGFGWNMVVGGDASLNSRDNVVGQQDGVTYNLRAFVDARINAEIFGSPLINSLDIEQGVSQQPGNELAQTQDRAELDSLYVYQLRPWIGPYVSLGAETNLFYSREFFDETLDVEKLDENGELVFSREDVDSTRLRPPFGLTNLREGVGFNIRPFKTLAAETILRVGFGARQTLTRDLFARTDDDDDDGEASFAAVPDSDQTGIEAIAIGRARIARYVFASIEFDSLLPFDTNLPAIVSVEGTVNVKLTEFFSINYLVRFLRNRNITENDQLSQDVLLRFSLAIP